MARGNSPDEHENLSSDIRKTVRREPVHRKQKVIDHATLVPSGSTLLNLACSDNPWGAYALGGIVTIPGASSSGKTILSLTTLAECSLLDRFKNYELILDDAEERLAFDINYLFGPAVSERIVQPPLGNSNTIQSFEANQLNLLKKGTPFIYVLDSFDSLTSDEELEKEMRKALAMAKSAEAAQKIAGSYGTEKAKIAGRILREINQSLKKSDSLLIMLQQQRQKMDSGPFGDKWTTAGGEAPFYYSNHQVWLSKMGTIKKKDMAIGTEAKCKLKKNSITGKLREVEFSIFYEYGIDNIGSCIDWLVNEGYWKKAGTRIVAEELDLTEMRGSLISAIEDKDLEPELIDTVAKYWKQRENDLKLDRKPKYE